MTMNGDGGTGGGPGKKVATRDFAAELKGALGVVVGLMNEAAAAGERFTFNIGLVDGKNVLTKLTIERNAL